MTRSCFQVKAALLAAVTVAALAACSSNNEETPIGGAPATAPTASDKESTGKVNPPLKAEQVNVSVTVLKQPVYDAAGDQLVLTVGVKNNGTITFPVTGSNPVTLGIVQKIPNSNGLPDKRGADTRGAFPADIAPGATGEVGITLPAAFVIGNKVEFEPLQESVAWFGFNFNQPTAVIGPFARCADGKGICDAQGTAVPAAN